MTAVEWLCEQYHLKQDIEIVKQAKEMEKQQIIDACNSQRNDYRGMPTYNKSGEQYYNETFKKQVMIAVLIIIVFIVSFNDRLFDYWKNK